jgi:hypothetical protein
VHARSPTFAQGLNREFCDRKGVVEFKPCATSVLPTSPGRTYVQRKPHLPRRLGTGMPSLHMQ